MLSVLSRVLGAYLILASAVQVARAQENELLNMAKQLATKFQTRTGGSVAVLGFASTDRSSEAFNNYLVSKLSVLLAGQAKDLRVINRSEVEGALRASGVQVSAEMTPTSIAIIAKRLGVTTVVSGSYTIFRTRVSVDAALYEASTGNLIGGPTAFRRF